MRNGVAPIKTEKPERQIEVTDAFGTVGGFLFHQVENKRWAASAANTERAEVSQRQVAKALGVRPRAGDDAVTVIRLATRGGCDGHP